MFIKEGQVFDNIVVNMTFPEEQDEYTVSRELLDNIQDSSLAGLGWETWRRDPTHLGYDPTYRLHYDNGDILMMNDTGNHTRWKNSDYKNNPYFITLLWLFEIPGYTQG